MERSALVEAIKQLTRALDQIVTLPSHAGTPSRRNQAASCADISAPACQRAMPGPEAKAASEGARWLIEQAEALGEPPEDPLPSVFGSPYEARSKRCCYSVRRRPCMRTMPRRCWRLPKSRAARASRSMLGHRVPWAVTSVVTGNFEKGRVHLDQVMSLYDPVGASICWRRRLCPNKIPQVDSRLVLSFAGAVGAWLSRGYQRRDTEQALHEAREIGAHWRH